MKKRTLWQVAGGTTLPEVEGYTVGNDYELDQKVFVPYDVQASIAHGRMLKSINVLSDDEFNTVNKALLEIKELWTHNQFEVKQSQEDCHTAIEQYITERYGPVGAKIHTGRSRNDQSLAMIRLYMKESLAHIIKEVSDLSQTLKSQSLKYEALQMPGYTHTQKAMPTTVGLWLDSYSSALSDCLPPLNGTLHQINQNPLGSAAGFGVSHLRLDREQTTEELEFGRVQSNPLYCGLSRGLFESAVLQSLLTPLSICSRFAADMMMFTMQELQFVSLPDSYTTGSSIMPQKRNYDVFEIMRGNGKVFLAKLTEINSTLSGLGSGYHRDLQLTKRPFVDAITICTGTLELMSTAVPDLKFDEDALKKAMTKELFVTDAVYKKVASGKSFRDAYGEVKTLWAEKKQIDESDS